MVSTHIWFELDHHTNLFINSVSLVFGQSNDPVDHLLWRRRQRGGVYLFTLPHFLEGVVGKIQECNWLETA